MSVREIKFDGVAHEVESDGASWEAVAPLGAGGQGQVFLARQTSSEREIDIAAGGVHQAIGPTVFRLIQDGKRTDECCEKITDAIVRLIRATIPQASQAPRFVLKVFRPRDDADAHRKRALREFEILADPMPGVVSLVDSGFLVDGRPWAVYPYYSRGSLLNARNRYRGAFGRSIALCVGVLLGLRHLHWRNVVHRDLKPANIFLDDELRPIIGDLGLAKDLSQNDELTLADESIGNRAFRPSWADFDPKALSDDKADMYSVGKLLHWLISGQPKALPREDHREEEFDLSLAWPDPAAEKVNEVLDRVLTRRRDGVKYENANEMINGLLDAQLSVSAAERF